MECNGRNDLAIDHRASPHLARVQRVNEESACMHTLIDFAVSTANGHRQRTFRLRIPRKLRGMKLFAASIPTRREICRSAVGPAEEIFSSSTQRSAETPGRNMGAEGRGRND